MRQGEKKEWRRERREEEGRVMKTHAGRLLGREEERKGEERLCQGNEGKEGEVEKQMKRLEVMEGRGR